MFPTTSANKKTPVLYALVIALLSVCTNIQAIEIALGIEASVDQLDGTITTPSQQSANFSISRGATLSPHFSLVSSEFYFYKRFGFISEFSLVAFETDVQEGNNAETTVKIKASDSKVKGWSAYVIPILYYRFGDKFDNGSNGYKISLGFGFGLGWLDADGKYIINKGKKPEQVYVSGNDGALAVGLIARIEIRGLFFKVTTVGPRDIKIKSTLDELNIEEAEAKYSLQKISAIVGFRYVLDAFN